jgi:hypothetical protein
MNPIKTLLCAAGLTILSGCVIEDDHTIVFVDAGVVQCVSNAVDININQAYLTEANIPVAYARCGYLRGISSPAVCGAGTSDVHLFSINKKDLANAENLGFAKVSSVEGGVEYQSCDESPFKGEL